MSQNLAVDPRPSSATESPPLPRPRLTPPSERDLLVYKRVKIWRDPQWAVAVDLQLHYSRVSQIVKKVEQWLLAGGSPTDPEIRDHVARRRLSRADHKLRLQRAAWNLTRKSNSSLDGAAIELAFDAFERNAIGRQIDTAG